MSAQSAHEQSTAHAGAGAEAERLEAEGPEAEGPEAEASGVVSTVSADASCAQLAETAVNAEAEAMDEALESSMDTMELADMEVTDAQSSNATSSEAEAEAKTKYSCGTCFLQVTINVRFGSRGSDRIGIATLVCRHGSSQLLHQRSRGPHHVTSVVKTQCARRLAKSRAGLLLEI